MIGGGIFIGPIGGPGDFSFIFNETAFNTYIPTFRRRRR